MFCSPSVAVHSLFWKRTLSDGNEHAFSLSPPLPRTTWLTLCWLFALWRGYTILQKIKVCNSCTWFSASTEYRSLSLHEQKCKIICNLPGHPVPKSSLTSPKLFVTTSSTGHLKQADLSHGKNFAFLVKNTTRMWGGGQSWAFLWV